MNGGYLAGNILTALCFKCFASSASMVDQCFVPMNPLTEEQLWEYMDGEMSAEEAARTESILRSCRKSRMRYLRLLETERCILHAVQHYHSDHKPLKNGPAEIPVCPSLYVDLFRIKGFKPITAGFSAVLVFIAGLLPFSLYSSDLGAFLFSTCEASLMFCFRTPLLYFAIFTLTVIWAIFIFDKLVIRRRFSH